MTVGSHWAPKVKAKRKVPLTDKIRKDGSTLGMDRAFLASERGNYDEVFEDTWKRFKKAVPSHAWGLAQENPFGGVEVRNRNGMDVSITSMDHGYMLWQVCRRIISGTKVVEIGGGFGGLARVLLWNHDVWLVLVDFPEILRIQQYYLRNTVPEACDRVIYSTTVPELGFDVAINTRSMCEMDIEEVNEYLGQIDRGVKRGGMFYSVNHDFCMNTFYDWHVPARWTMFQCREFYVPPETKHVPFMERKWSL